MHKHEHTKLEQNHPASDEVAADVLEQGPSNTAVAEEAQRARAVQRKGGDDISGDVQGVADSGLTGGGGALPHLDRIQRSFGDHDLSGVRAHVGGAAAGANAALGSRAYATGNDVAFASAPDLHTAAHEAAHVVQQRAGVSLSGGVGKVGDSYEQNADAVADRVVQGKSAGDLLGDHGGAPGVQRKAVQLEVDTSSGPSLPEYGENEKPGWQRDQGVPDWAKEEYTVEAKRNLVCSVDNGKIGSVYFDDDTRIRTVHGSGPVKGGQPDKITAQFNIDWAKAKVSFAMLFPTPSRNRKTRDRQFKRWLSNYLTNTPVDSLPPWIKPVDGPDTAMPMDETNDRGDTKLFEVFTNINGQVEGWHPSRGVAAKFATNKQVISVLNAALVHISTIQGAKPRNVAFYKFVAERLPDFIGYIRKPEEV